MRTIIIMLALFFITHTASAQTVPASPIKFKQAVRLENIRYSQDWHKRLKEINYDTSKKKAVLKQQFIKNYHSTSDPNQRAAYWDSYGKQVKAVVQAAQQQWAKEFEGLKDAHNYNLEQIYKNYGYTYTAPTK